jgi:hypothetical protein
MNLLSNTLLRVLAGAVLAGVTSCSGSPLEPREPRPSPDTWRAERARRLRATAAKAGSRDSHVVLLALDGVRWEEIFLGVDRSLAQRSRLPEVDVVPAPMLMPNLHRIIRESGVALGAPRVGEVISATGPNFVSTPGYMEMLTGRGPVRCRDNGCAPIDEPTLADEFASLPGMAATDVAVIASWEGLGKAASFDPRRVAISVGRSQGVTRGLLAYDEQAAQLLDQGSRDGPAPGVHNFRRDRATARIALRYLRVKRPRFLFLGLGEPDEYGHRNDYRGYLAAVRAADTVIGQVEVSLRELAASGHRTALFITTDHGRGRNFTGHGQEEPESGRVWLVATGTAISARGYVAAPVQRHLADLAPTIRLLESLPPDESRRRGHVLRELFQSPATELAMQPSTGVRPDLLP